MPFPIERECRAPTQRPKARPSFLSPVEVWLEPRPTSLYQLSDKGVNCPTPPPPSLALSPYLQAPPPTPAPITVDNIPFLVPLTSSLTLEWEPDNRSQVLDEAQLVWAQVARKLGRQHSITERGRWVIRESKHTEDLPSVPMEATPSDFTISAYFDSPTSIVSPDFEDVISFNDSPIALFDMSAPLISGPGTTPFNTPYIRRESLRRSHVVHRRLGLGRTENFPPSLIVRNDSAPKDPPRLNLDVIAALQALSAGSPISPVLSATGSEEESSRREHVHACGRTIGLGFMNL